MGVQIPEKLIHNFKVYRFRKLGGDDKHRLFAACKISLAIGPPRSVARNSHALIDGCTASVFYDLTSRSRSIHKGVELPVQEYGSDQSAGAERPTEGGVACQMPNQT